MPIDYKDYAPDWSQIREILERAQHKCEECGVANHAVGIRLADGSFVEAPEGKFAPGDWWAARKCIRIVLTIAHLDHNPDNNDPGNLKSLCQRCHNRYDAPVRAKNRRRSCA